MRQVQRGETPALIFFKPVRLLNQGRGDNGEEATDSVRVPGNGHRTTSNKTPSKERPPEESGGLKYSHEKQNFYAEFRVV